MPIVSQAAGAAQRRWDIRFGGMGGQGVVLLGDTLGLAGALSGRQVAASTSYGAQARGGASSSDVVLDSEPVDFPHVEQPHVMVLLSQEAYDVYTEKARAPAEDEPLLVLYDEFVITPKALSSDIRQVSINATKLALDTLESRQAANFVMLGALIGLTGMMSVDELLTGLKRRVSPSWWQVNSRAVMLGFDAIQSQR